MEKVPKFKIGNVLITLPGISRSYTYAIRKLAVFHGQSEFKELFKVPLCFVSRETRFIKRSGCDNYEVETHLALLSSQLVTTRWRPRSAFTQRNDVRYVFVYRPLFKVHTKLHRRFSTIFIYCHCNFYFVSSSEIGPN